MTSKISIAAAFVLIACLLTGFWIARHKYVWNDEVYSAVRSIHNASYADQWMGRIQEGNNAPLYYVLQKVFNQFAGYDVPPAWLEEQGNTDPASQTIMRIIPIVCMSLSITLVFYYFYRRYSLWAGLYSLFIYASSYMLWVYWAEARPYALIVLLTTAQSLLFMRMMEKTPKSHGIWKALTLVHLLLALTFILSVGQILAASILLWICGERDWKKYLVLTLVPVFTALFYYSHAPQYPFHFDYTPEQLLRDNISRDRFYILFIFIIFLGLQWLGTRFFWKRYPAGEGLHKAAPYAFFTVLALAATGVVMWMFTLKQSPAHQGFPISNRYFIYLMPIGVIAAVRCSIEVFRSLKHDKWLQMGLALGIALLVIPRFFKIVPSAIRSILGG